MAPKRERLGTGQIQGELSHNRYTAEKGSDLTVDSDHSSTERTYAGLSIQVKRSVFRRIPVESRRGAPAVSEGSSCCRRLRSSRCLSLHHSHVSSPRSSNRACGFPHPDLGRDHVVASERLLHVAPSGVPNASGALRRFHQSPCPYFRLTPSRTEASSLGRYYPASPVLRASPPPRRPKLVLADSRLASTRHRRGFPCCCCLPLAAPPPLRRRTRSVLASLTSRRLAAFPESTVGRLPHELVSRSARRSLTLRPACSLSRPKGDPLFIGVLQCSSIPPCTAPTASGWSNRCWTGFAPARTQRLSTAHDGLLA